MSRRRSILSGLKSLATDKIIQSAKSSIHRLSANQIRTIIKAVVATKSKEQLEKIIGDSGSKVTFDDIIMMGEGSKIHMEKNELKAASVTGEVIEQTRGPKLLVFKKKRRHN